tara:strand:+ start:808 stop:1308 length:501 start_codon:yes stop_codon:yes gene_type:complete
MNFIEKYSVPNYSDIKLKLITLINQVPKNSLKTNEQKISHTDYNLKKQDPFHYKQFFFDNVLKEYLKYFGNKFNRFKIEVDSLWFQIYKKGDFHDWHSHAKTNFANVFYLQLPHKNLKTNFKDCKDISIEEGDILTFPAYMLHRSPMNTNDKEKIIISWNSNFLDE